MDRERIKLQKVLDYKSREFKILKSHWKLFHKNAKELETAKPVYLRGVNEYMTPQNAVDLITEKYKDFGEIYNTYQNIVMAIKERNVDLLDETINSYQTTHTELDTCINTFKKNLRFIKNSIKFEYSNGPLEGINRKIKSLKRSCYGFSNIEYFFKRIDCLFA